MFNNFFKKNNAVYEKMWKNNEGADRPQMTKWRVRIACWISRATNTDSVISFPLPQQFHECTPVLLYTNNASLVESCIVVVVTLFGCQGNKMPKETF
jgi:hypothetical protein